MLNNRGLGNFCLLFCPVVAVTGVDALSSSSCFAGLPLVTIGKPLELLDPTHRGLHRFVPRHPDEIEIDIGDPIYVQREAEDLWCEGKVKHKLLLQWNYKLWYSSIVYLFIDKDQFMLE